jgi:signal transduction histidine kinase/CheY-like chemotaxis protein
MAQTYKPYQVTDITADLEDMAKDRFQFLLWGGIYIFWLSLTIAFTRGLMDVPLWVWSAAILGITFVLKHFNFRLAAWLYIVGISVIPVWQITLYGPNLTSSCLFLVPIIMSSLTQNRYATGWVAGINIVAVFLATLIKTDLGIALSATIMPSFVGALITVANFAIENSIMDMVHWAVDIQAKDASRAEMFYEQKVQLSEAVLQVQHANSALEIMNKKLEVAQQKAEQASQTKSVFLSNMSHELRTPLNIIIGYSSSMLNMPQMFNNVPLPDIYRNYLKLVEDNGHYLLGLINDILDLSKIEAGKLELHQEVTYLPETLRGILATSIGLLKDKPLQLRPDFSEQLPPVWADPMRIRQITLNLMSNAIKFTHTGNVTLSARVEGDFVRIAVTDTGIGIPEKALASIFDRFQQAEHDTDKRYGGTGLGLDISKQLSVMHGGDLDVQSVVNQGSTFSFTLPIVVAEQMKPVQPDEALDGTSQAFADAREAVAEMAVVLLVEDEVNTREMLHNALETSGYVVIDAAEGEQAMELATGLLPDLIILDAYLPGVDGWQVLQSLKSNSDTESIPVIMFTAAPDPERAYDLGAHLVLKKPVTPEEMISSIESVLYLYPNKENMSE